MRLDAKPARRFGETHVWAEPKYFLADESAVHSTYSCKGAAGLRPCLLCVNVYDGSTTRDIKWSSEILKHTDPLPDNFSPAHPAVIQAIFRKLARASAQDLPALETALGWTWAPGGFLHIPSPLWPTTSLIWDWMHVVFVNGVFNVHVGRLFWSLRECTGFSYEQIQPFLCGTTWGGGVRSEHMADIFGKKRASRHWKEGELKANASEGLTILPVLVVVLCEVSDKFDAARCHFLCLLALYKIVGMLRALSFGQPINTRALQSTIVGYLKLFAALYSEDATTPKFHYRRASQSHPSARRHLRAA